MRERSLWPALVWAFLWAFLGGIAVADIFPAAPPVMGAVGGISAGVAWLAVVWLRARWRMRTVATRAATVRTDHARDHALPGRTLYDPYCAECRRRHPFPYQTTAREFVSFTCPLTAEMKARMRWRIADRTADGAQDDMEGW